MNEQVYDFLFFRVAILRLQRGQLGASEKRSDKILIATIWTILALIIFIFEEFVRMEGDNNHRDLVPIGSGLRRHVYKHVDVGVYTPWEDGSDGEDPEGMIEWKSRAKQFYFDAPLNIWSTSYLSENTMGVQDYMRIGRRIRVVGMDLALEMRLSSVTSGAMIGTGTDFDVTLRPNGPCVIRVLLVINHGPSTFAAGAADIFYDDTFIGSGFDPAKFENYCCIFDKTYEFGNGGVIVDHVYIDCDFVMVYPDEADLQYPLENDIEFRFFVENGVNLSPVNHLQFRLWFEDY